MLQGPMHAWLALSHVACTKYFYCDRQQSLEVDRVTRKAITQLSPIAKAQAEIALCETTVLRIRRPENREEHDSDPRFQHNSDSLHDLVTS